jgi:hypothetical protein
MKGGQVYSIPQAGMFLVTVRRWYHTKHPMNCNHFVIFVRLHPNSSHSWFIHQSSLENTRREETPSSESEETWREITVNFADEISVSYSTGIF